MRDVWVDPSNLYTSIKMNTADLGSANTSRLLDLRKNGSSMFTVNKFGEMVFGTLDIPRVNNLEDTITTLSAGGLSLVSTIAATNTALQDNNGPSDPRQFPNNAIGLVYNDPILNNNDWYYKNGPLLEGNWVRTGLLPKLAEQLTPRKPVERTFYVTENGNDTDANTYVYQTSNTGGSIYKPFQSIEKALEVAGRVGESCIVIVHPGDYTVQPETVIPRNCALYGYDPRVTKLRLAPGDEEAEGNNMFLLTSGCKVRGFTFTDLRHEQSWYETEPLGDLEKGPPKRGYAFAFKPGEIITRSPYISDCTVIHDYSFDELSAPMDRDNGNPLVLSAGGNLYADGEVLDPDSPLRSVVVDSFTAVNPNGIAYAIVNSGFVQLVSVFTNWSRVGIWAHAGGQVTVVNSNATFGDYAFASTGYRYVVRVEGIAPFMPPNTPLDTRVNIGSYIRSNADNIVTYLMSNNSGYKSIPNFTSVILANNELANLTARDTKTILLETADDLVSGQDKGTIFWIQSTFKSVANTDIPHQADAALTFNANNFLELYKGTYQVIRDYLRSQTPIYEPDDPGGVANAMISAMFNLANSVISTPNNYYTIFQSKVEAASHQFSYAGSGVNYNAIPFGQRASGQATDPISNLYTSKGGVIYATFNTEQGDTYLGSDLKVDFERNTIEGQAFSRGVQNITLPLIIGVGG